jgi:hypothetical protein
LTDEERWVERTVLDLATRVIDHALVVEFVTHGEIRLAIEGLVDGLGENGVDAETLAVIRRLAVHIGRENKLCTEPIAGGATTRVWWRDRRAELAVACSHALREHDPLDPWLTESHWDDRYWDFEAEQIATRLDPAMSIAEVRATIVSTLGDSIAPAVDGDGRDQRRTARLDAVAAAVHRSLQTIYGGPSADQ